VNVIITPAICTDVRAARSRTSGAACRNGTPTPDAGVDADVQWGRFLARRRYAIERGTDRRVDHRHDVARDEIREVALVEWPHQEHGLANAGIPKRHRLVQLDHGKARDCGRGLEELCGVDHAEAVAVVLDDGEDRAGSDTAGDLRHVVLQVGSIHLDPGIERRVDRRRLHSTLLDRGLAAAERGQRDSSREHRPAGDLHRSVLT
jgi:hypothetical protein